MTTSRYIFCGTQLLVCALLSAQTSPQIGGILDRLGKRGGTTDSKSNDTIVSGLKEALRVSTGSAVALTGKTDGYFRNEAIKILMPEKLRMLEKGLRAAGMGQKVDDFELSMNRAAEKAAPEAKSIFLSAIRDMTLEDGRGILTGGNTAATDFFRTKTSASLTAAFRPIVARAMEEAGVTRQYKQLSAGIPAIPFVRTDSFNIDDYVVSKSLDGLFYMVAEEEKRIRTDPAARVTSLLKEVFGR
jgi:hypothetical protein